MDVAYFTNLMRGFSDVQVMSFEKNTLANANELYVLTTEDGDRYVIKFLDTQSVASVRTETMIQESIKSVGLASPQYLSFQNGNIIGNDNSRKFVLYEYLPGRQAAEITRGLIFSIGVTLAKVHQALQGITVEDNSGQWLNLDNATTDIARYSGKLKSSISKLLSGSAFILEDALPQALIHGDVTLSNILVKDKDVTSIFDFETAQNTARILDIARTFLSLKKTQNDSSKDILDTLVAGYDSWSPDRLTSAEKELLGVAVNYAAAACAAWCVNNQQLDSAEAYLRIATSFAD